MSREILLLVDALAREKNVEKDIVFAALEQALASATKKRFREDVDVRVEIDRNSGDYSSFRRWHVVPDELLEAADREMTVDQARALVSDIQLDEYIEDPLEPVEFGRIGAQTAKQVILQKIRDAEREQILNDFLARKEHVVFVGPVGVGKTMLAQCLGSTSVRAGHSVLFIRADALLAELGPGTRGSQL